jgi:hypothetical protein
MGVCVLSRRQLGENEWRTRHSKPRLKLEPVYVILLGLLTALGGVIWLWLKSPAVDPQVGPSFVLGARDPAAPAALRAYAVEGLAKGVLHEDFAKRVTKLADEFDAYRAEHGEGDPGRGLHRKDDPATIAEMRKGRSS